MYVTTTRLLISKRKWDSNEFGRGIRTLLFLFIYLFNVCGFSLTRSDTNLLVR